MNFLRIVRMGICKLTDNRKDCIYDPNLFWDDLDDDSKEKCFQGGPNGCRLKDEYLQGGPQPMNIEQDGGRRRRRRGRKSRKGRKGRKSARRSTRRESRAQRRSQ